MSTETGNIIKYNDFHYGKGMIKVAKIIKKKTALITSKSLLLRFNFTENFFWIHFESRAMTLWFRPTQ
jgi:hypothetical protein